MSCFVTLYGWHNEFTFHSRILLFIHWILFLTQNEQAIGGDSWMHFKTRERGRAFSRPANRLQCGYVNCCLHGFSGFRRFWSLLSTLCIIRYTHSFFFFAILIWSTQFNLIRCNHFHSLSIFMNQNGNYWHLFLLLIKKNELYFRARFVEPNRGNHRLSIRNTFTD